MADLAAVTPKQTASTVSNSIRAKYINDYVQGATLKRIYDQLASPIGKDMADLGRGSSVVVPFLSRMAPTTQTISETAEITPVVLRDATVSVTPTSRGNAVLYTEKVDLQNYTNFGAEVVKRVGENMMESVDILAMESALGAKLDRSPAARASLDAGTAGHLLKRSTFVNTSILLTSLKIPQYLTPRGMRWAAIMHPFVYADLMNDSNLLAIGQYQNAEMLLNNELGELNGFALVVTPWAKAYWGAGAARTSNVATTTTAAVNALATVIPVTAATNITVGMRLAIGTVETGTTFHHDNESVIVTAIDTLNISIVGEGENGGLKYDHASGVAVRSNDNVFPVVFGGPESMGKVYASEVGEYGEMVGPKVGGMLDQWTSIGWKWYGGYGIVSNNRLVKAEFASGQDA